MATLDPTSVLVDGFDDHLFLGARMTMLAGALGRHRQR